MSNRLLLPLWLQGSRGQLGELLMVVSFNEGMNDFEGSNSGNDDVTNPDNYFLVEAGLNTVIDTISCQGGLEPDDAQIVITGVSYNSTTFRATLTLANALPEGIYRLYVCGSTSNRDIALNLLNAGVDVTVDFTVGPAGAAAPAEVAGGAASPDDLPDTGFAPGGVSVLTAQTAQLAYAASDLVLNIPTLNIQLDIVGVPLVDNNWDVSWLAPSQAGYLQGTAWPTWAGNSAISAHVWNADNSAGPFYNLKNLQHGDQFTIVAWGRTYTYEVRTNRLVSDTNLGVLRGSDYSLITLITCENFNSATGEYAYRRAVQAVLISVE